MIRSFIIKSLYTILGIFIGIFMAILYINKNPVGQEKLAYLQGCTLGQTHLYRKFLAQKIDSVFCVNQSEVFFETMENSQKQMDIINSQRESENFL